MTKYVTLARKIQLVPIGDQAEVNRVYDYIRKAQYAQYRAMNILMGELGSVFYANNMVLDDTFNEARNRILRNSNVLLEGIEFPVGLDTKSLITRQVSKDFNSAIKNGLAKGERSINNYSRTNPALCRGTVLKFSHNAESEEDLKQKIFGDDIEITLSFVNKIRFKVVLGNPWKSRFLRSEFLNVFTGKYKVLGSKIKIDDKKKIMLHLSLSVPVEDYNPIRGNKFAVKLCENVTAVGIIQSDIGHNKYFGNAEEFLRERTALNVQRKKIQRGLKYAKGGKGRKRKLSYEKIGKREERFVKNYNHVISKDIVNCARKNKVETIILEDLQAYNNKTKQDEIKENDRNTQFLTTKWSYYMLQQDIKYKAERSGINVITKKVDLNQFSEEQIQEGAEVAMSMFGEEPKEPKKKKRKSKKAGEQPHS